MKEGKGAVLHRLRQGAMQQCALGVMDWYCARTLSDRDKAVAEQHGPYYGEPKTAPRMVGK